MLFLVSGYYVNVVGNIMFLIIFGRKLFVYDLCYDLMCYFCYSSFFGFFLILYDVLEIVSVYI